MENIEKVIGPKKDRSFLVFLILILLLLGDNF
ncbi:hypothetical protein ATZ99_01260 [Thermovenabulum gondwanense]|uniref:Uncharacterized protein n=1 Tax=Thermovenabulum gondwanense TaxID=520767 RepID=A0A162N012_9FIRM|nr:hypothetical protein ATZ99_01260 [Thermovenabulum gondwanense]